MDGIWATGHTLKKEDSAAAENGPVPLCGVMYLGNEMKPFCRTKPLIGAAMSNPACLLVARVAIRELYSVSCRKVNGVLSILALRFAVLGDCRIPLSKGVLEERWKRIPVESPLMGIARIDDRNSCDWTDYFQAKRLASSLHFAAQRE